MTESKAFQPVVRAIEDLSREVRDLRRSIEIEAKRGRVTLEPPSPEVVKIFQHEIESAHAIHLAFMDPNDPRPTCWDHSGLGGKFTITSHEDHVTCKKCLKVMAQNQ